MEIHIVHQQQLDQDYVGFPAPNHDLTVIGLLFYESDVEKDLIDWIRTKDNFNMYSLNTILNR
jgi:predicted nicotinamide N-methyase